MTIRRLCWSGITDREDHELIMLLERMHAEIGTAPLDEERMLAGRRLCLQSGIVLAAFDRDNDQLVGSLGLYVTRPWYSADGWHFADLWFYVLPAYRRSRHAVNLLQEAVKIAREANLPVQIAISDPTRAKAKHRLVARYLTPQGMFFRSG